MNVRVKFLTRKKLVDGDSAALLFEAAVWYAEKLLTPFQVERLNLKIALRSRETMDGCVGKCRSRCSELFPHNFEILLNRGLTTYWKIRVLAHEFVHLKQRMERRLHYDKVDGYWRPHWNGVNHAETPYSKRPWEIEAEAMEEGLAQEFLVDVKGWKIAGKKAA